jgi:hypothetical protein
MTEHQPQYIGFLAKEIAATVQDGQIIINGNNKQGDGLAIGINDEMALRLVIDLLQSLTESAKHHKRPSEPDQAERSVAMPHPQEMRIVLPPQHIPAIAFRFGQEWLPIGLHHSALTAMTSDAARLAQVLAAGSKNKQ